MGTSAENAAADAAPLAPNKASARSVGEPTAEPGLEAEAEDVKSAEDTGTSRMVDQRQQEAPESLPDETAVEAQGLPASPVRPAEGHLTFDPNIVTEIVHREAQGIAGIIELSGSFIDGWMKGKSRGIRVEEHGEEAYTLRLNVIVEYGTNCPELVKLARERITEAILHMTGRQTRRIDIHIAGIKDRAHREEHAEEIHAIGEEHGIDF